MTAGPVHPRALDHVPALDGVRGVAVIAVLLFHGGVAWLPGGFLGVDAFFVLSGYLITSILLAGPVDLPAFWERRARRLVPALAAMVLALLLLAVVAPLNAGARDALASLTYLSNWRFQAGGGYFESFEEPSVFKHTWSLAVEGQFYLFWPLLVVAVCRRAKGAVLAAAGCGALVSAWAMARSFSPVGDLNRAYYGTDTRMQAVLVGAALAVVLGGRAALLPRRTFLTVSGGIGAVLTLWLWHSTNGTGATLYRGGFLVAAVATAAVIACVVAVPDSRVARGLALRPLRLVGQVSYGLYLWHWPVFLLLTGERTHLGGLPLLVLRLAVTAGLAAGSWHLVEVPARHWSLPRPEVVKRAAYVTACLVLVASTVHWVRLPVPAPSSAAAEPLGAPATTRPAGPTAKAMKPAAKPVVTPSATRRTGPAKVLFVGDSVSRTLAEGLRDGDGFDVANAAVLGCGITTGGPYRYFGGTYQDLPQCAQWPATWGASVARERPDLVAVLVGRWECMDRMHDGRWMRLGEPAYDAYVAAQLDKMVGVVSATGAKVALMTAPYYKRGERPDGGRFPEDDPARVDRFNVILREVAAKHPGVTVVDLNTALAPEGVFTKRINGTLVRYDGVHISAAGAQLVRPWLFQQLRSAL